MKKTATAVIKFTDQIFSPLYRKFLQEKISLSIFLFHGLFLNEKQVHANHIDPQEGISVDSFRRFLEYYLNRGYTFVSPDDILNGLSSDKEYALISFDDGYFNNRYALPILMEYQTPAIFCISTNYIKHNKCFWWNVLYRERLQQGASIRKISFERRQLMSKTNEEIEQYLQYAFGEKAFKPISDIDRPFTASELKELSEEEYVFIGNHTIDHAILTNYPPDEIKSQILACQNDIREITGKSPKLISYPCGSYSDKVIAISKEIGLKLGVTVEPTKNYLPLRLRNSELMRLGRFILSGNKDLIKQCEVFRSDTVLYNWVKSLSKGKARK